MRLSGALLQKIMRMMLGMSEYHHHSQKLILAPAPLDNNSWINTYIKPAFQKELIAGEDHNSEHAIPNGFEPIAVDTIDFFNDFLNFLSQEDRYQSDFPDSEFIMSDMSNQNFAPYENTSTYLTALANYLEATPKKYFPFSSVQLMVSIENIDDVLLRIFTALNAHPEVTDLYLFRNYPDKPGMPYQLSSDLSQKLLAELSSPTMRNFTCLLHVNPSSESTPLLNEISKRRREKETAELQSAIKKYEVTQQKKASKKTAAAPLSATPAITRPVSLILETEVSIDIAQELDDAQIDASHLINRDQLITEFYKVNSPYRTIFIHAAISQQLPNFPDGIISGSYHAASNNIAPTFSSWVGKLWDQLLGSPSLSKTIKNITSAAFEKICSAPQFMTGGMSLNALPAGFYIQGDTLDYNIQLTTTKKKTNPLMRTWEPKAPFEPWVGDASQFSEKRSSKFVKFMTQLNNDARNISPQDMFDFLKELVTAIYTPDKIPENIHDFLTHYFLTNYPEYYDESISNSSKFTNISQLFILANLCCRYGKDGLAYFAETLKQLKEKNQTLHSRFLQYGFGADLKYVTENRFVNTKNAFASQDQFQAALSGPVVAWSSPETLITMRKLMQFSPNETIWWHKIIESEFNSVGYVELTTVYNGFRYFLDEIHKMGLVLTEDCPIQGPGPLTQLSNLLILLSAVSENRRQDQFSNLVVIDNSLDALLDEANTIHKKYTSKSDNSADFNQEEFLTFFKKIRKVIGHQFDDPISANLINTPEKTGQIIWDYFIQIRITLQNRKNNLSLTSDGALYAVQQDGFKITHPAMQLRPEQLLAGETTYKTDFQTLLSTEKSKDPQQHARLPLLCHRFLGSCGRELNDTYQVYAQFIQNLFDTKHDASIANAFAPILMMVISGRRGANAFDIEKLNTFLKNIKDKNKLNPILDALNTHANFQQLLNNNLSAPTLNELLDFIHIILESKTQAVSINTIDQLIRKHLPEGKFIASANEMRPPLAVKIERDYWGKLGSVSSVLAEIGKNNTQLDSFEKIEGMEHTQPTIIQLYRFALRIKQNKSAIIKGCKDLDGKTKARLNVGDLITMLEGEGKNIAAFTDGVASLLLSKEKKTTSIQGLFEKLIGEIFRDKLQRIASEFSQDNDSKKSERKLPAFEQLEKLFPQPRFPKIEIGEKTDQKKSTAQEATLTQYQADCQSIEKLYSTALALHRKWPTQFKLNEILKKIEKTPLTAFQLGTIFSAIQGIDTAHLPPELFELFTSNNFAKMSQTVSDILAFNNISLLNRINIIKGILDTPQNAPTIYDLQNLLKQYETNPTLCDFTSELFFKLNEEADIGVLLEGVAQLLKYASCDDIREKILANFTAEKAAVKELRALIDLFNTIDKNKKTLYLNIIAYGILDGDYTIAAETDSATQEPCPLVFSGDDAIAKKLADHIDIFARHYEPEREGEPGALFLLGLTPLKKLLETQNINEAEIQKAQSDPDGQRTNHIAAYLPNALIQRLKQFALINHEETAKDYLSSFHLQKLYFSILTVNALRFGKDDSEPKNDVPLQSPLLPDDAKIPKKLEALSPDEIKKLSAAYKNFFSDDVTKEDPDQVWQMRCEFLALACESLYRTSKKWPNEMQIMSVLTHMMDGGNVISEIPTGAGKSMTNALLAVMQWGEGNTVDFCTSNMELAKRDEKNYRRFYQSMGIKTHVITDASTPSDYVSGDIHFSDVSQLSLYRQKQRTEELVDPTKKHALILDEADLQLLTYTPSKQVSRNFTQGITNENPHENLFEAIVAYIENKSEFASVHALNQNHLNEFRDALNKEPASADVKRSARITTDDDLLEWLNAALVAQGLSEGKDYLIKSDDAKKLSRAVIIDSEGTPQEKPRFGKSVHAFLHANLNRRMKDDPEFSATCNHFPFVFEPSNWRISSETVRQFIRGYHVIWGNTGTLGGRNEARRLHSIYHATAFKCPSYYESKLQQRPSTCVNDAEHFSAIIKLIHENNRLPTPQPLLLFCRDMTAARALETYLLDNNIEKNKLQTHDAQAELIGQKASRVIEKAGSAGMVTITTSILGRGADFRLKDKHNGFHAVITSAQLDSRAVRQMAGRAGRQDDPGSWQFLVKRSELSGITDGSTPAAIDKAIEKVQNKIASESDKRLEKEERYADILHQYWEDFLRVSRELKPRITNLDLWKQCHNHNDNQQKLGAFFQKVERHYDSLSGQENIFDRLINFANNEWEKSVDKINQYTQETILKAQALGAVAQAAFTPSIARPIVSTEPRQLSAPKKDTLSFVARDVVSLSPATMKDTVDALPAFSSNLALYQANEELIKTLNGIRKSLRNLGVIKTGMDDIVLEIPTAVDQYAKLLLKAYLVNFKSDDLLSSFRQHTLIELRAQFLALLSAVSTYSNALNSAKKNKDTIIENLNTAVAQIKEAEKNASPRVTLEVARLENQVKRLLTTPVATKAVASASQSAKNPHWTRVKDYTEQHLGQYLNAWFVASDRKDAAQGIIQNCFYAHNNLNPHPVKHTALGEQPERSESKSLQLLLNKILTVQKEITEKDAQIDAGCLKFFKAPRNVNSSRLMDVLNDIATKIVQEQLTMNSEIPEIQLSREKNLILTDNTKSLISSLVDRQNQLKKERLFPAVPARYQTITKIDSNSLEISTEKLIQIRAQLLNNIDAFNELKYWAPTQKAFINLVKPTLAHLDVLIMQREKSLEPSQLTLNSDLTKTYYQPQPRKNIFNARVLNRTTEPSCQLPPADTNDDDAGNIKQNIKSENLLLEGSKTPENRSSLDPALKPSAKPEQYEAHSATDTGSRSISPTPSASTEETLTFAEMVAQACGEKLRTDFSNVIFTGDLADLTDDVKAKISNKTINLDAANFEGIDLICDVDKAKLLIAIYTKHPSIVVDDDTEGKILDTGGDTDKIEAIIQERNPNPLNHFVP